MAAPLPKIVRRVEGEGLDTLPERLALALARQQKMLHQDLLRLPLGDEVTRRDSLSARIRAQRAQLDLP